MKKPMITRVFVVVLVTTTTLSAAYYHRAWSEAETQRKEAVAALEKVHQAGVPAGKPDVQPETVDAILERSPAEITTASFGADDATLKELRDALAAKDFLITSLQHQISTNQEVQPFRERPSDRRTRLEELKKNDPQAYEEYLKRREEARQNINDSLARKSAFLLDRDTRSLTQEEQEHYAYMLNLLGETWQLADQVQQVDLPRGERHELRHAIHKNARELTPMLENERELEFYNLGLSVGYTEEEAVDFAAYVSEVVELTSLNNVFRSMYRGFRIPSGQTQQNGQPQEQR